MDRLQDRRRHPGDLFWDANFQGWHSTYKPEQHDIERINSGDRRCVRSGLGNSLVHYQRGHKEHSSIFWRQFIRTRINFHIGGRDRGSTGLGLFFTQYKPRN